MLIHSDKIRKQTNILTQIVYKSHRSWCQLISHIENVFSVRYCFLSAAFVRVFVSPSLFLCVGCCRCVWKIHPLSLSNTRLACLGWLPIFSPSLMDPQSLFLQCMFLLNWYSYIIQVPVRQDNWLNKCRLFLQVKHGAEYCVPLFLLAAHGGIPAAYLQLSLWPAGKRSGIQTDHPHQLYHTHCQYS